MDLNTDMDAIKDVLSMMKPKYIVNFAAQSEVAPSWENPGHWFRTNGVAIAELSSFLRGCPWLERYVHISSPEVYGTCEGVVLEDAPLNPSTPYAASKAAGDLMLFTLVKNFGFPLIMIRATNVYGARQQLFKIIIRAVIYIKMGKVIELHGGGKAVKSYIHIRDVSRGERMAMESGTPGDIYHLSPDQGISVHDVVRKICERMGVDMKDATRIVAERTGQDKAYVIDSSKARNTLGWRPEITMDQGLDQVIAWVDANWDAIRNEPLEYIHKP
jgi:dTDP-glucose 4,6-dehydratase